MADDHNCSSCLAFQVVTDELGECRRYAPASDHKPFQAKWPRVRQFDWCLQHRQSVAPFNLTYIPVDRIDNFGAGNG